MKIVLPVHHFPPRYSAGAELYTYRLARWLMAHGHDVDVVAIEAIDAGRNDALDVKHDVYDGVPVWRLSFDILSAPERKRWDFDNPLLGRWFLDYFQRARPDIAHFQAGYLLGVAPMFAAEQAGVATVLTLHDFWYLCPRHTLQRSDGSLCDVIPEDPGECAWCRAAEDTRVRLVDKATLGLAGWLVQGVGLAEQRTLMAERRDKLARALGVPHTVIAPSHFLASRFGGAVHANKLCVSGYGLDLTPFSQVRRDPVNAGDPLRIGYIGQLAPHKGVHVLVQAVKQLLADGRRIQLHLHGNLDGAPEYVRELRTLAQGNDRILFHGRFDNRQVARVLSGFDVSVVPSVWYENYPLAILEAYAAGNPVVATALGGMSEMVNDGVDGLKFKRADADDLTRQLRRLCDDRTLLSRLTTGARARRLDSIDDEMSTLLSIYQAVSGKVSDYQAESAIGAA